MDRNFHDSVFVFRDDGGNPFIAYIYKDTEKNGSLKLHTLTECVIDNKKIGPGVNVFRTKDQAEHPEILPI
jgi:hypothetical protein